MLAEKVERTSGQDSHNIIPFHGTIRKKPLIFLNQDSLNTTKGICTGTFFDLLNMPHNSLILKINNIFPTTVFTTPYRFFLSSILFRIIQTWFSISCKLLVSRCEWRQESWWLVKSCNLNCGDGS